jgi:cell volume regulation protein A
VASSVPLELAVALLALGALIAIAALVTRASRPSVPVALLFLGVGMLAGSEGLGGIAFDDHVLAYQLGTIALVLILFDGGLSTRFAHVRPFLGPATTLATAGVVVTAGVVAVAAHALGLPWAQAILLGAVVSPTDAAAVFSVLRGSGIHLQHRVGATIELESGLNDPMAVLLTVVMTEVAHGGDSVLTSLIWRVPMELAIGAAVGLGVAHGGRIMLHRVPPGVASLFPVVTTAIAAIAYGGATVLHGSGLLAVYVAGLTFGDEHQLPDRAGVRRIHDFLAWTGQVSVFLTLGLLVYPSQLVAVAPVAVALALTLLVAARPIAVALCLLPWRFRLHEAGYISWVGLRGAVPIVLATFPVMVGVTGAIDIFNLVFFVVVIGVVLQGATVPALTRRLGLVEVGPPPPAAAIAITSRRPLATRIVTFSVDERAAVANCTLAEIPFPDQAAVAMVVRGDELFAGRGALRLLPGDLVSVLCRPEDEPALVLWFGQRVDED